MNIDFFPNLAKRLELWMKQDDDAVTEKAIQHSNDRAATLLRNHGTLIIELLNSASERPAADADSPAGAVNTGGATPYGTVITPKEHPYNPACDCDYCIPVSDPDGYRKGDIGDVS